MTHPDPVGALLKQGAQRVVSVGLRADGVVLDVVAVTSADPALDNEPEAEARSITIALLRAAADGMEPAANQQVPDPQTRVEQAFAARRR